MGEAEDVRTIEAVALPADATAAAVISEGFQIDSGELATPRLAAMNLLGGHGCLVFYRPVGCQRASALSALAASVAWPVGWLGVGGLRLSICSLDRTRVIAFFAMSLTLLSLWSVLLLHAVFVVGRHGLAAWLEGRRLKTNLEKSQVRIRMKGGSDAQWRFGRAGVLPQYPAGRLSESARGKT